MSSLGKRRDSDVLKLSKFHHIFDKDSNLDWPEKKMMKDFTVELINDRNDLFNVVYHGPKDSPYESGVWKIKVQLPEAYPYEAPIITFVNKIFHPNIDENSGFICLNVINKSWSPMYDLVNVFEIFISQLLLYPNTSHGLNHDAIFLLMSDKEQFEQKVKEYCALYAKEENVIGSGVEAENGDEDVSESEDASSDEEAADSVTEHKG